jgi:hypothetical protein
MDRWSNPNSYTTTPKQDNREYQEAPIINVHYDHSITAVLKRIQALRGDLRLKGIAALARCDEKMGIAPNKHAHTTTLLEMHFFKLQT